MRRQSARITVVVAAVEPILRSAGFARRKSRWVRLREPLTDVVELQETQWPAAEQTQITLNIAVLHKQIFEICWGREVPTFPQETDGVVRRRIGELSDGRDVWWTLSEDNRQEIGREVTLAVRSKVLPFLDQIDKLEDLIRLIEEDLKTSARNTPLASIYLAIATALTNTDVAAQEILSKVAASNPAWVNRVNEVNTRLARR